MGVISSVVANLRRKRVKPLDLEWCLPTDKDSLCCNQATLVVSVCNKFQLLVKLAVHLKFLEISVNSVFEDDPVTPAQMQHGCGKLFTVVPFCLNVIVSLSSFVLVSAIMCEPRRQNEEDAPLLPNREDSNCIWNVFYFFSFLSGQYINVDVTRFFKKVVSIVGLILFGIQFLLYLGHVGTAVVVEVCRIRNINDTINTSNGTIKCTLPHVHWKFSTAITVGTFAAFFSYSFFTILLLMPVNGIFPCFSKCRRCIDSVFCNACSDTHRKVFKNGTLSPFDDSDISSELSNAQTRCFFFNYIIGYILFCLSFGFSIYFTISVYDNQQPFFNLGSCWISKLNVVKIALHFSTELCAIQSCFIFSKIVYKVTNKLKQLATDMDRVNFADGENDIEQVENDGIINELFQSNDKKKVDRARYFWLQKMDKDFIDQVKPTLDLLGVWFLVHWVMYALTTVLLTAFVLQNFLDIARNSITSMDHLLPKNLETPYFLYLCFFTVFHAYLFLYPCFRAASIAAARTKFISTVFGKQWLHVPIGIENNFIHYLKTQEFAFRVPLFCASITFEFNWVYVALILAICGSYLNFT